MGELRERVWRKVLRFRIFRAKEELDRRIVAQRRLSALLWEEEVRPIFGRAFAELFATPPAPAPLAAQLQMVGSSGYVLARDLHRAHAVDDRGARAAGVATMWFWMAAGVMDFLLDTGRSSSLAVADRISAETVAAALDLHGDPPAFDRHPRPDELAFLLGAVERGFMALRELGRAAPPGPHTDRLLVELRACLVRMVEAELRSPMLELRAGADLARVETDLRMVNTLTIWLAAYAGLLAAPRPSDDDLAALVEVSTAIGEIAWILDALSDIEIDLAEGVWSRVWLDVARACGGGGWLEADRVDREAALATLERSGVVEALLARVELLLLGVERGPALAEDARRALADTVRLWTWAFLSPPALR
jgi:hypothetical protein